MSSFSEFLQENAKYAEQEAKKFTEGEYPEAAEAARKNAQTFREIEARLLAKDADSARLDWMDEYGSELYYRVPGKISSRMTVLLDARTAIDRAMEAAK